MIFRIITIVAGSIIMVLTACNGGKQEETVCRQFPYIEVPLYITDRTEAAGYATKHFWDNYITTAKRDTSLLNLDRESFTKAYVEYINLLGAVGNAGADSHKKIFSFADSLYAAGEKRLLGRLMELSELYLYNPNSPYLNEELYLPALDAILSLKSIDSLHKLQYRYQRELALLNRTGTKAANFKYEYIKSLEPQLKKGYSTLHQTDAEHLLIYFNNPGCASCKEMQEILTSAPAVSYMIETGRLKILSMYIDRDTQSWQERYLNTPSNWIYARDYTHQLESNELYGIRAIPSLYLLDKEKRVILKDATAQKVVEYFSNRQN